jgi:transketolase
VALTETEKRHLESASSWVRLDILETWKQNSAPISGALSIVELYVVLFLKTLDLDNWAADPLRRARIIPKTTSANALYATLRLAGLMGSASSRPSDLPPVVHKDKWAGNVDGTLTRNIGQAIGLAFYANFTGSQAPVIAFVSEGDFQAGVDHQAKLASSWGLRNLTLVLDSNQMQSSRNVKEADHTLSADITGRFSKLETIWRNYGWDYLEIDGHDLVDIEAAFSRVGVQQRPLLIVAKTIKGKGIPFIENDPVKYIHRLTEAEHQEALAIARTNVEPRPQTQPPRTVTQSAKTEFRLPDVNYDRAAHPLDVFHTFAAEFRDINPDTVFLLNTDNPFPFDTNIPVYSPQYRSQHLQIGVNEKLALNIARGIANAGGLPIYSTPATHMQVVSEDLMHCALSRDSVLVIGTFPGVDLAHWGPSHASNRDMMQLSFPGMNVFQPATADDTWTILQNIYRRPSQYLPSYVRLPSREFMLNEPEYLPRNGFDTAFQNGFYWFGDPLARPDVLLVTSGTSLVECLRAAKVLKILGFRCAVANILNLTSINRRTINALAAVTKLIVSTIDADPDTLTTLLWRQLEPRWRPKVVSQGVDDFCVHDYTRDSALKAHGLDSDSLVKLVTRALGATASSRPPRKLSV